MLSKSKAEKNVTKSLTRDELNKSYRVQPSVADFNLFIERKKNNCNSLQDVRCNWMDFPRFVVKFSNGGER